MFSRSSSSGRSNPNEDSVSLLPIYDSIEQLNKTLDFAQRIDIDENNVVDNIATTQLIFNSLLADITATKVDLPISEDPTSTDFGYPIGHIGHCYISHIAHEKGVCFILDVEQMPIASLFFEPKMAPLKRLPRQNEIFAFHFQRKFMFRATRIDDDENCSGSHKIFLLDIGCIMKNDNRDTWRDYYKLSESSEVLPMYATSCIVQDQPSKVDLYSLLHTRVKYEIVDIDDDFTHIKILQTDNNPFRNHNEFVGGDHFFYMYFCWEFPDVESTLDWPEDNKSHHEEKADSTSDSSYKPRLITCQHEPVTKVHLAIENVSEVTANEPSNDQPPEPLNDLSKSDKSDELSASIHDQWTAHENRMQQFADTLDLSTTTDENNSHSVEQIDDEDWISTNKSPEQILPEIGTSIKLAPSFVVSVENFYGRLDSTPYKNQSKRLEDLFDEMNLAENKRKYEKLDEAPQIDDLVLAVDKMNFYRVRIASIYDPGNFQVFYVDYGNCGLCKMHELYKYSSKFADLPPFAIHCRLNGIKKIDKHDMKGRSLVEGYFNEFPLLNAKVVNIKQEHDQETLVVDLFDEHNINVAAMFGRKHFGEYLLAEKNENWTKEFHWKKTSLFGLWISNELLFCYYFQALINDFWLCTKKGTHLKIKMCLFLACLFVLFTGSEAKIDWRSWFF